MARKKTTSAGKGVKSIRHKDKRANIPTEELRDFVAEDEAAPRTMLYPRDPSLDPQLVWKGEDEQDAADLAVPVVPVYIQEKIHPQAIVDDLLAEARQRHEAEAAAKPQQQLDLFADFNDLPEDFAQRVEFYCHDANWSNRMILGDSLMVMTSLAEKEGLAGKVQCIYIDPPYGIKFASNWQVSTRKRDVKDGKADHATREPEQIRAFRDTWKLGIHSYLAYLRDRLVVARDLLTETGSIFVQIGDENVHLVRSVMDEVFGSGQYCGTITFTKTSGQTSTLVPTVADCLLWYSKDRSRVKFRQLYLQKTLGGEGTAEYFNVELADGTIRRLRRDEIENPKLLPDGARIFASDSIVSEGFSGENSADIELHHSGTKYVLRCGPKRHWKVGVEGTRRAWVIGRLLRREGLRIYKRYFTDFPYLPLTSVWTDTRGETDMTYVVQTAEKVVQRCLLMTTDPGDLVLDPTCGSGTTAYVAEQWGRRWITIDTSRVALALARTRLMSARYPYYLLADSPEGIEKEAELSGTGILPVEHRQDADATNADATNADATRGMGFQPMRELDVLKRQGAYLPHWTAEGMTYSVTFRLADSLPQAVLEAFRREREEIVGRAAKAGRSLTAKEELRLRQLFSERVERFLDAGHGECVLQDDRVASVVRDALAHFDDQRYDLFAWCIMPNHVHVILHPRPGHDLPDILHSWKSFTATQINRLLGRSGALWQPEYFDHLLRDAEDAERSVAYVLGNPDAAGLRDWKWRGMGFQPVKPPQDGPAPDHGQDARATEYEIRKGFVYKRVPHVTLKSIANNPDIKEGMTRAEIDAAIARHADQEILYDQPYVDNKRVRVSGPFTVESLSPHRVLPAADADFDGTVTEQEARKQQDFAQMILDNLRKAGVQNTRKNERLKFDTLEPLAGRWLHAAGEYTDADGKSHRAAVSLGPEHGTVGPNQVKEAAKEAVQGVGYDVLIVCGFAFDPHVSEEAKRYGKLTVLPTKMNPDLAMGDELLKKTGAGNLFMVFGEPDVEIRRVAPATTASRGTTKAKRTGDAKPATRSTPADDGEWLEVEIKGVDVYDPTTGAIRSSSTDDIACWFIDTNYNGESFSSATRTSPVQRSRTRN